jgi:hypothetical protein
VDFCPNCGTGVEPRAGFCWSCGADLEGDWVAEPVVAEESSPATASLPGAAATVADLSPRQLRREIRWGVFQGILLAAVIALVFYLVLVVLIFGAALSSGSVGAGS